MAQPSPIADLLQTPAAPDSASPAPVSPILDLLQNPTEQRITAADRRDAAIAGTGAGAATGLTIAGSTVGGMQAAAAVSKNPYVIGAGGLVGFGAGIAGSTFIDDLLKRTVVPEQYYKNPELLPYYEGGFTFGSTIASAPIIFGVPTLVGGRVANFINTTATTARQQPKATLFKEFTVGTSAGVAGGSSVAYDPNNIGLRLSSEIVAGVVNPTQLLVSGAQGLGSLIPLAKNRLGDTARENDAIKYLESILLETGEDPAKLIERLNAPLPEGVPTPSAGMKTGSMALTALENTLARTNRRYGSQIAEQARDAFGAYENLISAYRRTGDPEALRTAALMERQVFSNLLTNRRAIAEQDAAVRIRRILVDTPATRQRVGEIIKEETERSLKDARDYEQALWQQAEADSITRTSSGEIIPRNLTIENANRGLLDAVTSVSPEYLKGMQGYSTAEAILKRFGIEKENISAYELGRSTGSATATGAKTITVREAIRARGDLLALARNAAPNDVQAARIYGEMAESILKDLDTLALPAYNTARNYSAELNNFFTRTYVADINATSRSGAERFTPEVLVAKVFGSNNDITASRMQSVLDATGSLNARYQQLLADLGPNDPRVVELAPYAQASRDGLASVGDAQRQWLLLGANKSFVTDVDAPNGVRLNRNRLDNFITENETVLKDVGLLDDLKNANTAETTLRMVMDQNSAFNNGVKDQAAFAMLLGRESPTAVIADALGSKNPTRSMRRLITLAANAPDGGAAANGLKASLYDYAYAAAGGLDGTFSPTAYYDALHNPISLGKPSIMSIMRSSQLITAREANDLKRLILPLRRIEEGLANGLELDQVVGKEPSVIRNLAARVFGARAGAALGSGAGALIAAGAGSRASQNFFENAPNAMIEQLLKDATRNPELLAALLSKVDLSNPSNSGTLQRITTQFAISGFAPIPTAINNALQQNALANEAPPPPAAVPPQARVQPPSVPVRGVPGIDMPAAAAGGQAPPPPQLAANEMYRQLFPFG